MTPTAQLVISYTEGKPLQVTGPLQNRMLCYAMLEAARDAIRDYKPDESRIVAPRFDLGNGRELG